MNTINPVEYITNLESTCQQLVVSIIKEKKYHAKLTIENSAKFITNEIEILLTDKVNKQLDDNYKINKISDGFEIYIKPEYMEKLYNEEPIRKSLTYIHGMNLLRNERTKCENSINTIKNNFILSAMMGDDSLYAEYHYKLQHKILNGLVQSPYTIKLYHKQYKNIIMIKPEYINAMANNAQGLVPINELQRCMTALYSFYNIVSQVVTDPKHKDFTIYEIPVYGDKLYSENIIQIGKNSNFPLPPHLELIPQDEKILISIKKKLIYSILRDKGYKV